MGSCLEASGLNSGGIKENLIAKEIREAKTLRVIRRLYPIVVYSIIDNY